jgi:hypothetical protein
MAHACCPPCRVRFTTMSVTSFDACPQCGRPLKWIGSQQALGFRWLEIADLVPTDPVPRIAATESRPHASAVARLARALKEQAHLADATEQAKGSWRGAATVDAFSAARADVASRVAWLIWVELLESGRPLAVQPAQVIVPRHPTSHGHLTAIGPLPPPAKSA